MRPGKKKRSLRRMDIAFFEINFTQTSHCIDHAG